MALYGNFNDQTMLCSQIYKPLSAKNQEHFQRIFRKNADSGNCILFSKIMWALHDGDIAAFCTFSNRDELPPEYDFSPFVGFVFVDEKFRGRRLSGKLIEAACGLAREQGFTAIYLMSGEVGMCEKHGFRKIGDYGTIYGSVEQLFAREL